ncbi:MAG: basic amino acid/polyamine antiporter, family [Gammaproteobacteria bacterium]|jgi:APA family basic amino acid/polyamine antiporter|nr:basic amino acid/polyamine antiporter, family [Gammaproteobacteria bacterium]
MISAPSQTAANPGLTRGVGAWGAIAVNVANMIGTGVFLKTRVMTCNVGSPKAVLFVWLAAGLLALAGTFSYSEIAAMMPEAGGDYVYLKRAYGKAVGFLYGWMTFAVAKAGSQAALAVGLAIFMNVAARGALEQWRLEGSLFGYQLHVSGLTVVALATIWTVALINCASVTAGGRTALSLTIAKVALILGVGISAFVFAPGDGSHFSGSGFGGSCEGVADTARGGYAGFGAAMLGALWAYDGWNNVAPLSGEIRNPQRNLPRAFVGGMLVVASLYLFVNVAYYYAMTPLEIASVPTSSSVATEVLRRFLGPTAVSMTAVALMISSFGSLHASVLANSRVPYAMARDGLFFRGLARLSPRSNVPARAIVAQAAWGSVLALSGSYDTLTDSVVFASWLFYGLSTGSLFVFRRTMPNAPRPYRALGYPVVPVIFLLVTAALLINTFVAAPRQALQGVAVLLAGLPLYWYWSRKNPGL